MRPGRKQTINAPLAIALYEKGMSIKRIALYLSAMLDRSPPFHSRSIHKAIIRYDKEMNGEKRTARKA